MTRKRRFSKMSESDLALLAAVRRGDRRAEARVVKHFEPVLLWRLKRTPVGRYTLPHDDLLQEYRITLLQCARSWSPDHGALFSTYLVRALVNCEEKAVRMARPGGVMEARGKELILYSLDVLAGEDEDETFAGLIPDPDSQRPYAQLTLLDWVCDVLADVPDQLDAILTHFGLGGRVALTNGELASALGLSKQGASHRIHKGLRILRERVGEVDLSDILVRDEFSA